MQNIFKKYLNTALMLSMLAVVGMSLFFTSCKKEEEKEKLELLSYGPMPVARGAELRFIGTRLDEVTSIVIPDGIEITKAEFTSHSTSLITLTVPQNAVEGLVVLKTASGDITTKTPIGFSEPISIESFSPETIKPGSVLTITGDYLNLIHEVIFTDRVAANDTAVKFVSQSRKELKVVVPSEAQTGKIAISNGAEDPIIVYSESELKVTLPALTSLSPKPVKSGTELTVTGTDLDLVVSVTFGGDLTVDSSAFNSQSVTEIKVTVPGNAEDGKIGLTTASGIIITSADDLVMVSPTVSLSPTTIKNGDTLTVTGTDLDLINAVTFENGSEGTIEDGGTETAIKLLVPITATSGEVTFYTVNNKTVSGGSISIIEPTIKAITPDTVAAGSDITITGTDLDLVVSVTFGGDQTVDVTPESDTSITVTVPTTAETGVLTLTLVNGETVTTNSITVDKPLFCYIPVLPSETDTIKEGELFIVEVSNEDKLTDVQVNGVSVQYILNGTKLYILVPENTSGTTEFTLISSNGDITYELDVVGGGIVEKVIWSEGPLMITWSDGGRVVLPASDFTDVPAGSIMRFYFSDNDGAWAQAQVNDGQWSAFYTFVPSDIAEYDWWNVKNTARTYDDTLTSGMLDSIIANQAVGGDFDGAGIIIQGSDLIFSKVSLIIDNSAPPAIWEGSAEVSGWSASFTTLTWGGYDFSGLSVGQTMYVYYTAAADATMRIGNGSWAAFPSTIAIAEASGDTSGEGNISIPAGTSSISFTLTAEDITAIQTEGGFGVYGGDFYVTKVAIK